METLIPRYLPDPLPIDLLALERELRSETGQDAFERYDVALFTLGERCRQTLRCGLPPHEYTRCAALHDILILARKLLRVARNRPHPHP